MKTGHTVISHSIAPILEDFHIVRNIPNQYTSIKLMTRTKEKKRGKMTIKTLNISSFFVWKSFTKCYFSAIKILYVITIYTYRYLIIKGISHPYVYGDEINKPKRFKSYTSKLLKSLKLYS